MKFIIGLGNPGAEYQKNRHNIGFMLIDQLLESVSGSAVWQSNNKLKAEIAKIGQTIFIKPQNYMNNSGQVSAQVINFFQKDWKLEDVVVIHDDLDIRLGENKIQLGKGPKAHNGILDLDRHLGGSNYWHVRVGVDSRTPEMKNIGGADYVLENFTSEEMDKLSQTNQSLINQLKDMIEM